MIHLESPRILPADKFIAPFSGWCLFPTAEEGVTISIGNETLPCRLEPRNDVEAAYPGRTARGFRGILNALEWPGVPPLECGTMKLKVELAGGEIAEFPIGVAESWIDDLVRLKRASTMTGVELGLGLTSGDTHYRAYVGRPEEFDLSAASAFQLLVLLGLRQYHRLLDVGCGSLRTGRLLIPYLNRGNYLGVEPNEWLVNSGIEHELGRDILAVKRPTFAYSSDPAVLESLPCSNYALANSIFSHASVRQIDDWLRHVSRNLCQSGALVATYLVGKEDYTGDEWVYPGCVRYRRQTMEQLAARNGLKFVDLPWRHLHGQKWALFARPAFDLTIARAAELSWNSVMAPLAD